MFNKKQDDNLIQELKDRIAELETQLNEVANDNGSIIIKQLPNGQIELNGIEIDKDSPVEYYNSSKATYGELTMFRIGKESKQREMDKLIQTHMTEIDELNIKISRLQEDITMLQNKSKIDDDTIQMYENNEKNLKIENDKLYRDIIELGKEYEEDKKVIVDRYESMIDNLEEDIKNWKNRYLKINNVKLDGTIITKYGTISSNNQNEGE